MQLRAIVQIYHRNCLSFVPLSPAKIVVHKNSLCKEPKMYLIGCPRNEHESCTDRADENGNGHENNDNNSDETTKLKSTMPYSTTSCQNA